MSKVIDKSYKAKINLTK